MSVTNWVAGKLAGCKEFKSIERTPEDFLVLTLADNNSFVVAILGIKGTIELSDVTPLFTNTNKPKLVVNVPSGVLWNSAAIDHIHAESAAFGTLGDISRAAATGDVGSYRDKNMGFFINAMTQHSNVSSVSYIFDKVFKVDRKVGASLAVAVVDAYNMSAEDVRNARTHLGHFDVIVKSSSYGSITTQAEAAAKSMGAQALTFGELMGRLAN